MNWNTSTDQTPAFIAAFYKLRQQEHQCKTPKHIAPFKHYSIPLIPSNPHRVGANVARKEKDQSNQGDLEVATLHAGEQREQEIDGHLEHRAQPLRKFDTQPWREVRHGCQLEEQHQQPAGEKYLVKERGGVRVVKGIVERIKGCVHQTMQEEV